jgi:hypothetical protein
MKRGVWVGGLILSLGGWASDLLAQDGAWRPAPAGPVPITLAPSELKPCPAAAIGRPIPVFDEPTYPPLPALPASGVVPAAYQPPFFPPGSAAPTAKEIPGGNNLPTWEDVDDEKVSAPTGDSFASDRDQLTLPTTAASTSVKQVGLAGSSATATVVPESSGWASPLPTTLPPVGDGTPGNPYPFMEDGGSGPFTFGDVPPELNPLTAHFYVSAEYLLWWTKKDTAPPLVSTSADGTGVTDRFGFLNQSSTSVLFGGPYNGGARSGFRGNAGFWLDTWCEEAVEFGGFFLASRNKGFGASTDQNSILARPFFNVNNNTEFAELVGFPGIATGHVTISAPSSLWGLDTNLRCNVCLTCDQRFDLLLGFRYLNLNEGLTIAEFVQGGPNAPAPFTNAQTVVVYSFNTHNQFYGGQVGFTSEWKYGPWSLDVRGKLALGATEQQLTINGIESITAANGTTSSFNGGLLALPSNIGNHYKTHFSVVPEVGLTVGYQVTNAIRVYAGYNFLYWSNVARPGEQIDRNLDVTQIPNFTIAGARPTGQPNPSVPFKQSDYWAQGILIGIEFRY